MYRMNVKVHWNFHKKCFSVVGPSGRVMMHALTLCLSYAEFKVSAAGNARVRREGVKNVHARVHGTLSEPPVGVGQYRPVTYNPYKHTTFVYERSGEPALTARLVLFSVENGRPRVLVR